MVRSSDPFIKPADRPAIQSTPTSTDVHFTDSSASKHQSTSKSGIDRPHSDRPRASNSSSTDLPVLHKQSTSQVSTERTRKDSVSSLDLYAESDQSDQPPVDLYVEEGELSDQDQDVTAADPDQSLSEKQTYRETMRGIWSYMGWTHIPDIDASASTSYDNPFAGPKTQTPGKVSVQMPTVDWLCRKLNIKLNLTLVEGYPSWSSEASGLLKDQFLRHYPSCGETMEHLTDFVFVSMGNLTLARRDSYLTHVKSGIKPDTLSALRTAPLQLSTLFPDSILKWAEDDIAAIKTRDILLTARVSIIPMNVWIESLTRNPTYPHERTEKVKVGNTRISHITTVPEQPSACSHINDNHSIQTGLLAGSNRTVQCFSTPRTTGKTLDVQTPQFQVVHFTVVNHALSVIGQ